MAVKTPINSIRHVHEIFPFCCLRSVAGPCGERWDGVVVRTLCVLAFRCSYLEAAAARVTYPECLTATISQPLSNYWLSSWSNGGCSVFLSCMLFICILSLPLFFCFFSLLVSPSPVRSMTCYLLFFKDCRVTLLRSLNGKINNLHIAYLTDSLNIN